MKDRASLVPLGDVCSRLTVGHVGSMAHEYVSEGVPFLRSQNVKRFGLELKDVKHVSSQFHTRLEKSALKPGDVVIVRTGYPGTAAVIPPTLADSNCADLVVITPGPDLNPYYLEALLNSTWGLAAVSGRLVGAAQQHFNVSAARAMVISLPDMLVQERIVAVLRAYQALIENNTQRTQHLEEVARTVYREWFVDFRYPGHQDAPLVDSSLGPIPAGWDVRHLGELCRLVKRPFLSSEHSDLPLLDMARMQRGTLAVSEVGDPDELSSSRTVFEENDVLFGSIRPYLHKVALAPFRGVTNTSVLTIRAKEDGLQAFLAVVLSSDATIAWADQHATGTKMPVIKWSALERMPVVVPDKAALGRFGEAIAPLLAFLKLGYACNRNLMSTRNLLLPRLLSGEVDVSRIAIDTSGRVA